MSTPDERMRCLIWGGQLLWDIQEGEGLLLEHRDRARDLHLAYPSEDDLRLLVRSQAKAMHTDHASSIGAAGRLFNAVQQSAYGSAELRSLVLFTLRHFPAERLAESWAKGFFPGIEDWLAEP